MRSSHAMIEEREDCNCLKEARIDIRTLVSKPTFLLGRAVAMQEVSLIGLELKKV
ncbi:hypothetical protein [Pajaroellobacter abortibovis]|uniref:hypothetical protein n=1 Tax=Pajaroellobacter abortibovis TaxID=1882918 RepID=UPI0012EC53FD|nr:hypothetical protein [Pajaroellobacter abortibovis]